MVQRVKWDPAEHPRGPVGRFVTVQGGAPFKSAKVHGAQRGVLDQTETYAPAIDSAYARGFEGLPMNKLAPEQRQAMEHYVYSSQLNDNLRAGTSLGHREPQVKILDDAIEQSRLKQDTLVYRGSDLSGLGIDRDIAPGDQIVDRGFMSTSNNPAVAADYGENLMEIELPKGTHALPISKVNTYEYGGMNEVLVGRGSVIEIDSIDESQMEYLGYRVIRARLVGYVED